MFGGSHAEHLTWNHGRTYRKDYDEFASVDTSIVWTQFPVHVHVLTLHGLKDAVVPPYDAFIYARIYGARNPGTHTLRYVEDADHNFTGVSLVQVSDAAETYLMYRRFRRWW